MENLLTIDKIPNCWNMPQVGRVKSEEVFPIVSHINTEPDFLIHGDGSIYQLFWIDGFNIKDIDTITENLPTDSACQIYKLHSKERDTYFYSLYKRIDYGFLKPSLTDIPIHLFKGMGNISKRLNSETEESVHSLLKCITANSHSVGRKQNSLMESLSDCKVSEGGVKLLHPIKTNLSLLLTGKARYSTVVSLGNLDYIPSVHNILDDFDYTLCFSIVRTDELQQAHIRNKSMTLKNLISKLSRQKGTPKIESPRVDSIMVTKGDIHNALNSDTYFINANYLISSRDSVEKLNEKIDSFQHRFYDAICFTYHHTTSARSQYISMFPGNANYGSYFQLVNEKFLFTACRKILSL